MSKYLINPDTIQKSAYLPDKLSQLSKHDPQSALEILRYWGDGEKPITELWDLVCDKLQTLNMPA
ncbi:hypothetical protein G3M81_12590 [Bacillus paralicheniformis]|uniref:hypothetical protein n=1 Tax=Bacillus TaxID=1386 RepID=UPI0013EF3FCC|nr:MULTISPECIES: hypothetical protein [Bacillus]MCY8609942.1 hypothetical protein [Bacillus haynesii]MEC0752177.1 hypothetical protein [Bacillus haynesii]QII49526.1 hypothetical protein G3M81_12590 [Bacillus paralicheniformis]